MKIVWNRVTPLSQAMAIILFVAVLLVGFQLGRKFQTVFILGTPLSTATFTCDSREIFAEFYPRSVHLEFGGQKTLYLPQAISASGARYANADESLVFWNKGNEAIIMRDNSMDQDYKNCRTAEPSSFSGNTL
ncbi:MAG: hypothetical protein JWN89_382 [Parcubacteria group bacterium]|nr:hypothetical protein [Parcubacteria group bacterium]